MLRPVIRISMTVPFRRLAGIAAIALLAAAGPAGAQQADLPPPPTGPQQQVERIAAVINDEILSQSDVAGRLKLAIVTSGLPDGVETRQRLLPQVMRLLVDETLQLQEARRLNLVVTEEEIDRTLKGLAEQNRMNLDQFREALVRSGVPYSTLRQQARANLAWSKLVQRRIRPTIQISDEEIDAYVERLKENAGKPEYLVSEIFIPVDTAANEEEAARLAERLVEQVGRGANFGAVAQQFSQTANAAAGGDMGWIQQGQLEPELDRALQLLQAGQMSRPLRGSTGFHILLVRDQRLVTAGNPAEIKVALRQLVLPLTGTDPKPQYDIAEEIAKQATSCDALGQAAAQVPGSQMGELPMTPLGEIPENFSRIVSRLGVGQPSQPLVTDRGVMLLMVCDREVPEGSTPPRDQIINQLGLERMDMLQRRYLRDLRRTAFIDMRV
ncbi:MAG TPA: peptidylprolyl isomerase [Azospirillaceae bacterium]|nr:peptidylprolyl isomerase [Azospirillaceae bacterium]